MQNNNNNNNFNNFKNQRYLEKKLEINKTDNFNIIPTNLNNSKKKNNKLTPKSKNLNVEKKEKKLDVPKPNNIEITVNTNNPENLINTKSEEKNLNNSNFLNKKLKRNPSPSQEFNDFPNVNETTNYLDFLNEIEKIKKTLKTKYENSQGEPKKYHLNYDAFENKIDSDLNNMRRMSVKYLEKEIFENQNKTTNEKTENKLNNLKKSIFKKIKNFKERLNEVEENQSDNEKNLDLIYFNDTYYYNFYKFLEKEIENLFKQELIDETLKNLLELVCEEHKHKAQETYYYERNLAKNLKIKDKIIIEPKIFKSPIKHQIMIEIANSTIDSLNSILMSKNSKIFFIKTTSKIKKGKKIQ